MAPRARAFIGFVAAISIGLLGSGVGTQAAAADVLKIGAPLAAIGPEAREGALAKQGYDLWADTVNAHGGIKIGGKAYQVQIIYYDD